MTITRANLEDLLIKRCGKVLTIVGLDGTTIDGTNADLNDPIGSALRQSGYSVSNPVAVSDADVGAADETLDQVLDLAELRLLKNIQSNMTGVDFTIGPHRESLSQIGTRIDKRIEQLTEQIARDYGVGLGTLDAGVVVLDSAEIDEDE